MGVKLQERGLDEDSSGDGLTIRETLDSRDGGLGSA